MKSAYRILAYIIAIDVAIQAAAIAFAFYGLIKWIGGGGVLNKAGMEGGASSFPEEVGFMIHGINGQIIIPLLAIVLLIVAFFAKVNRGVQWAALLLVLIIVQIVLGMLGSAVPFVGLLHGLNALAVFVVAVLAGQRVRAQAPKVPERVAGALV